MSEIIHSLTGLLAVSIPVVAIVSFSPIGRAIGQRILASRPASPDAERMNERLKRLEQHTSFIQTQMIELQDERRFEERLRHKSAEQGELRQKVLA